ncbi:glyoxalase/bleomycin resistance protein/dioxygenase superfamily protein [Lentzea atacamensis]|uniref:Glyoxalase/bleomycin resistance protein/dioxygenase superfamily protein n=1 Tax=Lentzea atacamensis TaxID=531938 RepID=A0A316IFS0_9PSEU|nr:glyoxalase/bleomycin resistance protein/dioxygenase superfamily protein [Lentzea atacamensis]
MSRSPGALCTVAEDQSDTVSRKQVVDAATVTHVASRITELVLDCTDPERLATFWGEVLGYDVLGRGDDWAEIGPPDKRSTLLFLRNPDRKLQKLRLHIDVTATDREQDAELERLLALGATPVDISQGEVSWHVLADPEGNEFCLLSGRADP